MAQKPIRRSIERKILRSILWVGLTPTILALIIAYVVAHEGQRHAVEQNLLTAARRTADGVQLAVKGRVRGVEELAKSPDVQRVLRTYKAGGELDLESLNRRMQEEIQDSEELSSSFEVFDHTGHRVAGTGTPSEGDGDHPEWLRDLKETTFIRFVARENPERYGAQVAAPIHDESTGELLGFVSDEQNIGDFMQFVLGQNVGPHGQRVSENIYEVIYITESGGYLVYLDQINESGQPELSYRPYADEKLIERIRHQPARLFDTLSLWDYRTRDQEIPVLLAYHRLLDRADVYLVVYRPRLDVFANINAAAVISFCITLFLIGCFCIIAYRNVHNNIIRPLSLLNEGAQIIRQGDLELKLKIGTGDEIEELASSFNKMASALRQNINQLEESEEKYRSLITSMRDGIYQADEDGLVTFINPAGTEILGFKDASEVLGLKLREIFIEEIDYAKITNELSRTRFIERTRVWMRKEGTRSICVELTANQIVDELGAVLGMEGTFRDVTQSVRLEQAARERSERIAAINQIANVINSSLEAGRVFESLAAEVKRLVHFDYAAVALIDERGEAFQMRQLWPEPESRRQPALQLDDENCCAGWVAREHRCLIVNDLQADSSPFAKEFPESTRSCLCLPLYATGRIIGTLNLGTGAKGGFTKHDIDVLEQMSPHVAVAIRNAMLLENLQHSLEEVTRAREELHKANEELKTLDEMKTNLLSNVSHELRTPLVSVMGYTDMILNEKAGPINEVQQEYLGITLRNVEKLVTLIENLLDFSRLHRGQEEMMFDTFDIVDCARTCIDIVRPVADGRAIALALDAPGEPVLLEGDKGKMGQVFNNLLSNAVKFNDNGGSVTIEIRVNNDMVDVAVVDTGIGIPPEALDKVFTRFYQYDGSSTRKYGGTGIGLAIAQDIMRLHGGRITVSSEINKGSTFRFSLPLSGAQRSSRDDQAPKLPPPIETHLLVELVTQDRALSAQVRNMLISEGMDVIHAAYPSAAIGLASKYGPDVMVVDTDAGPTGSVVVEEILSSPQAIDVPVVLISNDDELYERYRGQIAGRIKRGFRKSSLLSGIHYALSKGMFSGANLGGKILCVDDDREVLTFMSRLLEAEGYELDCCRTGEAAIEKAQTGDYWLVLLDIAMPGMDGWETCQRIKAELGAAGIKVYLVTAKPIDRTMREVQESGADGYLLKPFKADDLVALLQGFEAPRTTTPNS
jgi:PAS domain S-box-containing protein